MFLYFAFIIAYVIGCGSAATAQSPLPNPASTLDSLRAELERVESKLNQVTASEEGVLAELEVVEEKVALQQELVQRQRMSVQLMQDSIQWLSGEVAAQENALWDMAEDLESLSETRAGIAKSLGSALLIDHRLGKWAALELIAGADSWQQLAERRALVQQFRDRQVNAASSLRRSADSLSAIERNLRERTHTLQERKTALEQQVVAAALLEQQLLIDEYLLAEEKTSLQKRLKGVRGDRELLRTRQRDIASATSAIEDLVTRMSRGEAVTGVSLQLLKGYLPWPVSGTVVEPFGLVRNVALKTVTENPGIDLATAGSAEIASVAEGRVSSVSHLRGFGNVCIVEHPGQFYTVYARLARVAVQVNDPVSAGTVIGTSGYDSSTEQYRVHFEFWSGRDKKDPLEWLQPR